MEKTGLKVLLGFLVVMLVASSSMLVVAVTTGKSPIDILFPVDKEKAVVIAQNYAPQGTVEEVEVATADNPVHEVEIQEGDKETEVRVDANTGEVLSVEEEYETEEDEGPDVPITGSALDRAKAAALEVVCKGDSSCDARVTDTEVGDEESYYEVEIRYNGREIDVQLDEDFNFVGYD